MVESWSGFDGGIKLTLVGLDGGIIVKAMGRRTAGFGPAAWRNSAGNLPTGASAHRKWTGNRMAAVSRRPLTLRRLTLSRRVSYRQQDGSLTPATVAVVDATIQPPSYGVLLDVAPDVVRETEGHRLAARDGVEDAKGAAREEAGPTSAADAGAEQARRGRVLRWV
jgi:hypothetical protein